MHWVTSMHLLLASSQGPFPASQSWLHADVNGPGDEANLYYVPVNNLAKESALFVHFNYFSDIKNFHEVDKSSW